MSIVISVFDEEESVGPFVEAVDAVMAEHGIDAEYVFVNDGSRDDTLAELVALQEGRTNLRIIDFSRNFGKEAAMTAGIDASRGDVVIPIDVDLQEPPELIPKLLAKWRDGYDVVLAVRGSRRTDSFLKRVTARLFYRVAGLMFTSSIHPDTGDYRLMDRSVIDAFGRFEERNRFMRGLFSWVGFTTTYIYFERPPRQTGHSKFNFWKLWNFALDGMVSFSATPLKVWTYVGILSALLAFSYAAYLVVRTLVFGVDTPGYASIMVVVLLSLSLNLISIGILGEYVGRMFIELKRRPLYIVRREIEPAGARSGEREEKRGRRVISYAHRPTDADREPQP